MLRTLKFLLPALVPSWRFFDVIAPSPRIQFVWSESRADNIEHVSWREFRPPPAHISLIGMLGHLFWNPRRNETLYLVSCAERLLQGYTRHSEDEILRRIARELAAQTGYLQFRLLLVKRVGDSLQHTVAFHSRIQVLPMRDGL
ncbi:MAG TPA: hypothetical protein ENI97_02035 [Gammaproteobacteria bacterium]|nr:hypothetical protein [Gammaproteobacteria bacterium]